MGQGQKLFTLKLKKLNEKRILLYYRVQSPPNFKVLGGFFLKGGRGKTEVRKQLFWRFSFWVQTQNFGSIPYFIILF